jgi:hypothetical protein
MPTITNANLNAPCLMIGEKGADLILKFWERYGQGISESEEQTDSNIERKEDEKSITPELPYVHQNLHGHTSQDRATTTTDSAQEYETWENTTIIPDLTATTSAEEATTLPVYDIDPRKR